MKCMIAFACLLAVASAGYVNNAVVSAYGVEDDGSYKGEFYNGALGYNGAYGGAYAGALGYNGALGYSGAYNGALGYANHGSHAVAYNAPLVSAPHPVHVGYAGPLAHAYSGYAHGYAHASPIAHGYAHAAPIAHGYAHAGLASEARLVDPVAIAAGAPLPGGDTVEVAAAKAFHHQAHVEAKTGHLLAKGHFIAKRSPAILATGFAAPLAYSAPAHSYGYSSYASPLAYSGYTGYGYGGHLGAYYG